MLARGGAQREEPLLGALQLARIEVAARGSPPRARAAPPPDDRARRSAPRACSSSRPGMSADLRSSRRARPTSSGTGEALPPTSSCASSRSPAIFSARIRNCRRSASARLLARLRRQAPPAPRPRRADSRPRARAASSAARSRAASLLQLLQAAVARGHLRRVRLQPAEGVEQPPVLLRRRPARGRRAGRGSRPAARRSPAAAPRCTAGR